MTRLTLAALLLAGIAAAQPRITGIQNNYSYLLPGTPNYAIAQGSIVVLYGANMAPAGLLQQGFNPALNRNLGGVSIRITVGATTTEAIPYYVSPGQITAILPSATPVGAGSITVTYNGQTSPPFSVTIVQSAFGILTMGGNGLGTAAVFDQAFNYIGPTNAANPGQVVYFWGTGQGPDPNDETRLIAAPQNLGNLPFEFYIANKPARVLYHGRSQFPGLDQIAVEVPAGVAGCYVSAYAKTGNLMSNFVSFPVAASGRVCTDYFSSSADVQRLLGTGKTEIKAGWYYLGRFTSYSPAIGGQPPRTTITDAATAQFISYTTFDFHNWGGVGWAAPGCITNAYLSNSPFSPPIAKRLDAGPSVTLTLPGGATRTLPRAATGSEYAFTVSDSTPGAQLFIPAGGGAFQFRAPGGADIGANEGLLSSTTPLVWNERPTLTAVNRNGDLTVTWRGGTPGSFVLIQGVSTDGRNPSLVTTFGCTELAEAGRFTIPRDVLASMIPSAEVAPGFFTGQFIVANYSLPARFTAPGLDHGSITWFTWETITVRFQ